jgi:hypothetical protein
MIGGKAMLEFNMMDARATIEIDSFGLSADLILNDGDSKLKITFSQNNLEYLKQKLSPNGLMPDSFEGQIHMINDLIEELEDIRDKDNPDWELRTVYYNEEADTTFFDTKEVE